MSHLDVSIAEDPLRRLFEVVRDRLVIPNPSPGRVPRKDGRLFNVEIEYQAHLENGKFSIGYDRPFDEWLCYVSKLDIAWDILKFDFGIDIPTLTVGGFCLDPFCIIEVPEIKIFDGKPDLRFVVDLSKVLVSELSVDFDVYAKYEVNPDRTPEMTDLDAEDKKVFHRWHLKMDPKRSDFDLIDIEGVISKILLDPLEKEIRNILSFFPDWVTDVVMYIVGALFDLLKAVLDAPDDFQEWFKRHFIPWTTLGDIFVDKAFKDQARKKPLAELEDPYPLMKAAPNPNGPGELIPVKVQLRQVVADVGQDELVLAIDIGA